MFIGVIGEVLTVLEHPIDHAAVHIAQAGQEAMRLLPVDDTERRSAEFDMRHRRTLSVARGSDVEGVRNFV